MYLIYHKDIVLVGNGQLLYDQQCTGSYRLMNPFASEVAPCASSLAHTISFRPLQCRDCVKHQPVPMVGLKPQLQTAEESGVKTLQAEKGTLFATAVTACSVQGCMLTLIQYACMFSFIEVQTKGLNAHIT